LKVRTFLKEEGDLIERKLVLSRAKRRVTGRPSTQRGESQGLERDDDDTRGKKSRKREPRREKSGVGGETA